MQCGIHNIAQPYRPPWPVTGTAVLAEIVRNISLLSTVLEVYSEIVLSRKPFGTGHMYIHTSLLRMADTLTPRRLTFPPGTRSII
jgi:hypothetical protein